MLIEDFKAEYTAIPFAANTRQHKKNTRKNNIDTLFHIHREMEIMLVLEGRAKVYADTKAYDIEKGDIVFIPPYVPHRYTIFSRFDFSHYCLCFDLALLNDSELQAQLENGTLGITTIVKNDETCAGYIKNAFEANLQKPNGWALRTVGNLSLLFATLAEQAQLFRTATSAKKSVYYQIVDYIARNFTATITSADIANALHMNNSYFCRLFRKTFGYCFQNYLCMYRIEKSKPLLKNTRLSVSEIAYKVGFNSPSYYSKKFKEYTASSPREYRRADP